jgi:transcription antitermination factor NusG
MMMQSNSYKVSVGINTLNPWFALQTTARNEREVERLLTREGYECFLPTYRQKSQCSDRVVELEVPLFPEYVFCRFNPSALGKAISTPGVVRIAEFEGQPVEVEIKEIEALQLLVQSNFLREPWGRIPDGSLIQVETGPLTGVRGIFCAGRGNGCLVISVTALQQSVAVRLDEKTVVSVIEGPKNADGIFGRESDFELKPINRVKDRDA